MNRKRSVRLQQLNRRIVSCRLCGRLTDYCARIATEKRAAYRNETYHGRPVPNFGDLTGDARVLVVGLAPGAHGANRTGRMFTGDRSGDFLYRAMHEAGFANQPESARADDGLELRHAIVTAAGHCAPPDNKPSREELAACAPFFEETFDLNPDLRVAVCLGRIALDAVLDLYRRRGWIAKRSPYRFAHGAEFAIDGRPAILCSYHPSQQNTFTGRLTREMLRDIFRRAAAIAGV